MRFTVWLLGAEVFTIALEGTEPDPEPDTEAVPDAGTLATNLAIVGDADTGMGFRAPAMWDYPDDSG